MIRNDNGFMSVCVLQFYMGAILAGNRKTVFSRSLIISCEVIGIFWYLLFNLKTI